MATKTSAHDIRDHGYVVQRTLPEGSSAVLTEDCFYGGPLPKGTRVRVLGYNNGGFRGIDARVEVLDTNDRVMVNAGCLEGC
jgi:hypothetical protein